MRGLSLHPPPRPDGPERGASLALVAMSLVWIVGLTSLVVDIGGGWTSRHELVSATDAAALAAAQDLVGQPTDHAGACATAGTYVATNAPTATVTDCSVTPLGAAGGRLTIGASEDFEPLFTDLTEDRAVHSISTATWGPPVTVSSLRPVAFCYDGFDALRQVIDNPPSSPTTIVVPFYRDDPTACGGVANVGNFATIDFAGGTANSEIEDWVLDGYPGQIGFEAPTTTACDGGVTCYERPYASGYIESELLALRQRASYETFPIYDYADAVEIHLVGVIRARLISFDIDGPPDEWGFELKIGPGLVTGTCCGPPGLSSGNKVIALCGVDPDAYEACQPEGGA